MPRYAITEKAGRFVAGQNNTGAGTILTLTEKQAEHEVRLGTLRALGAPVRAEAPVPDPTKPEEATSEDISEPRSAAGSKKQRNFRPKDGD